MSGLIFWDVDTQYDFMRPDGRLYVPDAESLNENLSRLTDHARTAGIRIVASADDHTMADAEISDDPDFQDTFPPHCMRGTEGQRRIPQTMPLDPLVIGMELRDPAELGRAVRNHRGEIVIHKQTVRVFDNPNTATVVRALDPAEVVVYGVALDICNRHAIEGLLEHCPGATISVVTDATKPINADTAEALLAEWEARGVRLITTDEALRKGAGLEVGGTTTP
jgi:nicotinamidase/pyrazinamidase